MKVTGLGSLELHAHLDGEARSHAADVLVLAVEARVARLREHDAPHVLRDVADCHGHFVVLIWLDVYF